MRLSMRPNGQVLVTAPFLVSSRTINKFISQNQPWIEKQSKTYLKLYEFRKNPIIAPGLEVVFADVKKVKVKKNSQKILLFCPDQVKDNWSAYELIRKPLKNALGDLSKQTLTLKLDILSKRYDLAYNALKLRYMRSRWGSCHHGKIITLNSQLLRLPDDLIDYVLLHELAHTKHMNHGRDFHAVMLSLMPDYRKRQKDLKKYQLFY